MTLKACETAYSELDGVIHQPVRTRIVAFLANAGVSGFVELKSALGLSDGHMSTHMRQLIKAGYVDAKKEFVKDKPKTTYSLTPVGKKEFSRYLDQLRSILTQ